MFEQTLAIIRNTFFESIRQPVMLVVLFVASLLIVFSNPLSAFTMGDDQRMLIDIGLATVFLGGALLAAFVATSVLTREIENKTALTVISKPVSRPVFVIGKFLGVGGAMVLGALLMAFVFLLVERHAVIQTVRDPVHLPVLTFGTLAAVIALGLGIWCNFFYGMSFSATVICSATPLAGLAYLFSLMFRPDFSPQPISESFKPELWLAILCLMIALLVLTAVAVAASTRLGQVMTLCVTLGVFLLGMMSDAMFGKRIDTIEQAWLDRAVAQGLTEQDTRTLRIELASTGEVREVERDIDVPTVPLRTLAQGGELIAWTTCWVGYAAIPNFQRLWLADAITQDHVIPPSYVARSSLYGVIHILVMLALAVLLFQRREVA